MSFEEKDKSFRISYTEGYNQALDDFIVLFNNQKDSKGYLRIEFDRFELSDWIKQLRK